jgi:hypothetical protein
MEGFIERIFYSNQPPLWFDPDLSGFRSELRNSTAFDNALIISAHPELVEGHERLYTFHTAQDASS